MAIFSPRFDFKLWVRLSGSNRKKAAYYSTFMVKVQLCPSVFIVDLCPLFLMRSAFGLWVEMTENVYSKYSTLNDIDGNRIRNRNFRFPFISFKCLSCQRKEKRKTI